MNAAVLLVAAGRGERLGTDVPKAFVEIRGRSLLQLCVIALSAVPEVGLVVAIVPLGREDDARAALSTLGPRVETVAGGETRQASVRAGLAALPRDSDAVVCHDVARPFASPRLYRAVLGALQGADGAVPALPVADTVKRVEESRVVESLPRDELVFVQTPQAFRRGALEESHQRAVETAMTATDDAALLEAAGFRIVTVPGDARNLKITTPADLEIAAAFAGSADG
ncbi:MAG: 2-C-methyl-D-erythritol 4-phosphate cytidylyltransferase [Actinomycetota bacterium]